MIIVIMIFVIVIIIVVVIMFNSFIDVYCMIKQTASTCPFIYYQLHTFKCQIHVMLQWSRRFWPVNSLPKDSKADEGGHGAFHDMRIVRNTDFVIMQDLLQECGHLLQNKTSEV